MRVRWTTDADDDLERSCDYIARDRPAVACRVAEDITKAVGELVLAPLPFVAVYEVQEDEILHSANPARSTAMAVA